MALVRLDTKKNIQKMNKQVYGIKFLQYLTVAANCQPSCSKRKKTFETPPAQGRKKAAKF
jgi:hypothetical protein